MSRRCHSHPQCKACKRKHHPSICNQNAADPFVLTPNTSALCSMSVRSLLLQTANPRNPETRLELRMLLDGGSQHSYMTERARRMLNLDPDGEQQLSIAAFGSARGGPKVCPIISVGVILKGYPSSYSLSQQFVSL